MQDTHSTLVTQFIDVVSEEVVVVQQLCMAGKNDFFAGSRTRQLK